MSCVTVKVPWAPQPLACMRRSGITSRSKCAIFSINQISCSSAGPRGPAVMMLVLSATGAPVALVKRFSLDMISSFIALAQMCEIGWDSIAWLAGLPAPGGSSDHAAEIAALEVRILVRQHVGLDVAEGCLRLVLDAVVEGLDDVFLEMRRPRMGVHDRIAFRVAILGIAQSEHIHFDAGRHQSYDRVHVLRAAGGCAQCDRGPDGVDILLRDTVAAQEVTRGIGAV